MWQHLWLQLKSEVFSARYVPQIVTIRAEKS
jgi:hypothetical protein